MISSVLKSDGENSAVSRGAYSVPSFAITEMHYHPIDPTAAEIDAMYVDVDLFEFIALRNISGAL